MTATIAVILIRLTAFVCKVMPIVLACCRQIHSKLCLSGHQVSTAVLRSDSGNRADTGNAAL